MANDPVAAHAPLVFVLHGSEGLGRAICSHLGTSPAAHEERVFEDGEHKARPLLEVEGRDAYVIHTLHRGAESGPDARIVRLLFFIGALRGAGVARVTAVTPYLAYARKDQRTRPNDPVATRHLAALFEAVGTDALVAVDVHNVAAFDNAFRIPCENLDPGDVLAARIAEIVGGADCAVVSPDAGGIKRAERFRRELGARLGRDVPAAMVEKHRRGGELTGGRLFGDVSGRTAILVDDLVATGSTLARAARACGEAGAVRVLAAATHAAFTPESDAALRGCGIERFLVTDTVEREPPRRAVGDIELETVSVAPLIAASIARRARLAPSQA